MKRDKGSDLNWPLVVIMLLLIGAISLVQRCGDENRTPYEPSVAEP